MVSHACKCEFQSVLQYYYVYFTIWASDSVVALAAVTLSQLSSVLRWLIDRVYVVQRRCLCPHCKPATRRGKVRVGPRGSSDSECSDEEVDEMTKVKSSTLEKISLSLNQEATKNSLIS